MKHRCFTLKELAVIHKSLIKLCGMPDHKAMELLYHLNTANIDTLRHLYGLRLHSGGPIRFCYEIGGRGYPYPTIAQLAKALENLLENIVISALTAEQRLAVRRAEAIADGIHDRLEELDDALLDALLRQIRVEL